MTHEERIARLMHSANNCKQMLHAIDRKLAEALICLDDGQTDDCKEMLASLKTALPEAIAVLQHEDWATASAVSGTGNTARP